MQFRTLKKYMDVVPLQVGDNPGTMYVPKEGILIGDWYDGMNGLGLVSICKIFVPRGPAVEFYVVDAAGEVLEAYNSIADLEEADIKVYRQISR